MSKMSLLEKQMYKANIKLQDELRSTKDDVKVLITYILGLSKDKFLVKRVIKKYRSLIPAQEGRHD